MRTTIAIAALIVLTTSACAEHGNGVDPPTPTDTTGPGTPTSVGAAGTTPTAHPTRIDRLVVAVGDWLLISGDGTVYRRGQDVVSVGAASPGLHTPLIAPPRAPDPFEVARLTPAGLATIFNRVSVLGLAGGSLPAGDFVWWPDEGRTRVEIVTDAGTISHRLPGGWADYEREHRDGLPELAVFIDELVNLDRLVGAANLSAWSPYVPVRWKLTSGFRDGLEISGDEARPWPLEQPAGLGDCVVLPSAADHDTATGAYTQPGSDGADPVYAEPAFPWTEC